MRRDKDTVPMCCRVERRRKKSSDIFGTGRLSFENDRLGLQGHGLLCWWVTEMRGRRGSCHLKVGKDVVDRFHVPRAHPRLETLGDRLSPCACLGLSTLRWFACVRSAVCLRTESRSRHRLSLPSPLVPSLNACLWPVGRWQTVRRSWASCWRGVPL